MDRHHQLKYCKKCTHKDVALKKGIICKLTGERATFENTCDDYIISEEEKAREQKIITSIRPNLKRAQLAQKFILGVLALEIICIISSYFQYDLLIELQNGYFVTNDRLESNDLRETIIGVIYMIVFFSSAFFFLQWFRRAYYNLGLRTPTDHTDGWALGAWVVPIISIYRPYQMMKELWMKSTELINDKSDEKIKFFNLTPFIGIWWALWIISNYIGKYVIKSSFKSETVEDYINLTIAEISTSILGIPLAYVVYRIIKEYSSIEEQLTVVEKESLSDEHV